MSKIEDQWERDLIEQELDTSFLVEAGAGSGKTRSMVQRMIALIKKEKASVDQIAAITFTKKAAAELQGRFLIALEKASRNTSDDHEGRLLRAAYENVNQAFIGTIHSFCGNLLRERPFEAGLDPAFTELDDNQALEFQDQCWDEYLAELMIQGQTDQLDELMDIGVEMETLRSAYNRMVSNLDVDVFTEDVTYPNFDRIRTTLLPLIDDAVQYIPAEPPEKGWDASQKMIKDALQLLKIKDIQEDMTVLELAELFNKTMGVTLNRWLDEDVAKDFRDNQFPDWQQFVLEPFLRSWRQYIHPKLVRFVLPAVDYYQERKQERGLVDFQDLLMKAAKLLREHPTVRAYFNKRYTRLLVDEFQDTDPIQAEMMLLLTGEDVDEHDWKKQVPKAGSLFIVGDPKQSIYRFRRADISTYHFVKEKIKENGQVLRLTTNFRSVKAIGEFVDQIFEPKFLQEDVDTPVQATFANMNTVQDNPEGDGLLHGVRTISHERVHRHSEKQILAMDTEKVASYIAWACQGNLKVRERDGSGAFVSRDAKPGDFLILLSETKNLHLYAEKLEEYGIVSDITGSKTRYEELLALYHLVKCLNDSYDQVALLAVLRGLFFGCSDDALYHYKKAATYLRLYPLLEEESVTEATAPVREALGKMQQYMIWVKQLPALTAFMRVIEDIGLIPYTAVQFSGLIRAGTLVQIIDRIQNDSFASADWNDLTLLMESLLDEEKTKGIEGTGLFAGSTDAVRVMNLHKAKGLEASIVLLAGPFGAKEHGITEHIDRMGEEPAGYFAFDVMEYKRRKVVAEPTGWLEKVKIEREFVDAEQDRLLYVAATRPEQLLIISQYIGKPSLSPWEALSHLTEEDDELTWEEGVPAEKEPLQEAPDLRKALLDWNSWRELAARPSFSRINVTTMVKTESDEFLPRSKEGKGMAFGNVVHHCMEQIGKGVGREDLTSLVAMLAEEEGLDAMYHADAVAVIEGLLASEVWKRSERAKQTYHEFSFMLEKGTEQIQGVIDLAFEEEDGWVIVDYKTDTFSSGDESLFVDYYRTQVNIYSDVWQETFHYKVKEKGLYFTNIDRYVVVE